MKAPSFCRLFVFVLAVSSAWPARPSFADGPKFALQPGDRVAIIGNTLADRMQHDAWLETYIHALHPEHDLVFRNLGFPGDELKVRYREDNFGSPDEWLSKVGADVVFAFFGYNEALKGEAGLESFRSDLAEVIDGMLGRQYNGESTPRLVFFSPLAHEDLGSPHLPDGSENNRKLQMYTEAMRQVCAAKSVPFVDLFTPSTRLYAESSEPLTINGIHLSEDGGRRIAEVICGELFGTARPAGDEAELARLREAIQERNYYWFSRYRVVDGYNVFGGRSKLEWFGQSNADVMMREMEIFDVMTANRDQRVWAVARGGDIEVRDDNLPPELKVKTNKPGDREDGSYSYSDGTEAIDKMRVHEGMQVNLFADERMFPELINPVQMSVDPDGDLYVAVWPSYPHWNPTQPREDRILRLRDENGDGVADSCVIFADELNSVTGFEFWGGGMLVAALPELWFLKDTTGDGRADYRVRMLQGLSSADSHHSANAMLIGPDGWLYWSRGIFNTASIETPTQTYRSNKTGVHRFNPRTFEMEFHFPIGPNPHGDVFDRWGYQFANDGTSGTGSYVNIGKGIGNKHWFEKRVRPVAATGILSSSHFPDEHQGNFLIANTIGFLGVLQHEVRYNGADITAVEVDPILVSDDPNFRPSDLVMGSDGALYVSDWHNALIGHMQHNMRDPNRDDRHGRIYRVTYSGRPPVEPVRLKGKPIREVLEAFYASENSTRYRARIELSGRDSDEVVRELTAWAAERDVSDAADAQALLESLWVLEEHRVPRGDLVAKVFAAEEPRVRAAAIRTLGHWAGKVPEWRELLLAAARDDSPLVRAEAVKAAVEFPADEAAEVIYIAHGRPTDPELDTVLKYAVSQMSIGQVLRASIQAGEALSDDALAYALRHASPQDLAKLPPTEQVYEAILARSDASVEVLGGALQGLAELRGGDPRALSLTLLEQRDAAESAEAVGGVARWLAAQSASSLTAGRNRIERLAGGGKLAVTRQAAYDLLIGRIGAVDRAYSVASQNPETLVDFLAAARRVANAEISEQLYPIVRSLMFDGDASPVDSDSPGEPGLRVEYYQPNPSDVAVETLDKLTPKATAIVPQITLDVPPRKRTDHYALRFSGMLSVSRPGSYTFALASDDGSRLYINDKPVINHDGLHGMSEKTGKVDLSAGRHRIVLTYFNNTGGYGLDLQWSGPQMRKGPIPPEALSIDSDGPSIRELAIQTLGAIPGHEAEKWNDLTSLIKAGQGRAAAVRVLNAIAEDKRPGERLGDLADNLVAYLSDMPPALRTGEAAEQASELVRSLAKRLPERHAAELESRLENLDVRVIAVGTVKERMIYDKEQIAVQAGRPVEFRFSNSDAMPHNFVIVRAGTLEEVGELAEATSRRADAKERHYVPQSPAVMLASKMLESGQSEALLFETPDEPGIYPYVCTYPGHWRRMYGALYVVADLESYRADPERYLAENPLEMKDELLKYLARDTEWKYDDLISKLHPLPAGRSFEVGKQVFKATACVACHQFGGEGHPLGPDLAKMEDKRQTPEYILRSILEPSADIDDKYRSYRFLLDSGQVLTGTVVEENDRVVKVLSDPLNVREPSEIDKDEIEQRVASPVSIMPDGLLNKLTEEEIVDLVAYILAKGDAKHAVYGDGHSHGGHGDHGDH